MNTIAFVPALRSSKLKLTTVLFSDFKSTSLYSGLYVRHHASILRKYGNSICLRRVSNFTVNGFDDDELHLELIFFRLNPFLQ
jgi:hypothetical protein